jgi:hypothetical protein
VTPRKRKAPVDAGADAITKTNLPSTRIDQGGFWAKAASGKVRPAPREPGVTHYGCSYCRWSA